MKSPTSLSIFVAAVLPLLGASDAHANGAVSEFAAGGVTFKHENAIAIAREDLDIGVSRIHVHYVFRSSAHKPLVRTIGFPLAKVPQDDSSDGISNTSQAGDKGDIRNYMDFKVSVNGKPVTRLKHHEYAWLDGKNVTAKLHRLGVPIYAGTAALFAKLAQLPAPTVRALARDKLVEGDKVDHWLVPQWLYQSVYEWRQTFAPGRTEVDISYTPLIGASNAYEAYAPGGSEAGAYCLGDAVKRKFATLQAKDEPAPEPSTVGYILKTARNWHGPIGEFHLTITDKNAFHSFCVPKGLQRAAGGKGWEAKNFVPESDLHFIFYGDD